MRTGSLFDVVEVLKSLSYLSRSKNLSFREKRMLDRAKFLVTSEIAEVTREDLPTVEVKVEEALERSSSSKNRTIARQAAAKAAKVTPAAAVTVGGAVGAVAAVGGAVAGIRRAARAS